MTAHETTSRRTIAGRYTVLAEIGRGGMGVVWRGKDEILGRDVALKRIGLLPGADSPDLRRAEREARLAASLNHPHLVAVFDLVHDQDEQWLVMEYVDGANLAQVVRSRGPLTPDQAAAALGPVADALATAHRAGIVHRDVKPSNLLVTVDGAVKLSDFGIARTSTDATLTQTGLVTGSPSYLAPEVATGHGASAASDVWAFGSTLYHALAGRPPFEVTGNVVAALYRIVHEDPPALPSAGWLHPVLEHTLARDAAERWTMEQVRDYLAGGASSAATTAELTVAPTPAPAPIRTELLPEHRRRVGTAIAGVSALILAALLGGWGLTRLGGDDPEKSAVTAQPSAPAPAEPTPDRAASMQAFVQDYLATVTDDPAAAWAMLTPEFQDASDGFGGYRRFWSTIASARVSGVDADPGTGRVSYTVSYERRDGSRWRDQVTLRLTEGADGWLIAGES